MKIFIFTRHTLTAVLTAALFGSAINDAQADSVLDLRKTFIEKYKNRLTIECNYYVDAAHKHPNAAAKDGDLHVAGRCSEVGLPMVAEVQNAAESSDAVDAIHAVEGTGHTLNVVGVWRIWPEHGGDEVQRQTVGPGSVWEGSPPTNPPHVFEVHPLTQVGMIDLVNTLTPIEGFIEKEAADAFQRYEASSFEITPSAKRAKLRMRMVGYNYVKFVFELAHRYDRVSDGVFLAGSILSTDGELLVRNRRVGFVAGTAPDNAQKNMAIGQCLEVLGIPRVDLALVSWRMANVANRPGVLKWSMPYEIVAVGVYGPAKDCDEIADQ